MNSYLQFDTAAGNLVRCIKEFDNDFNSDDPKNDHKVIKGEHVEKWMLKIVCGLIASKQIASQGEKTNVLLKEEYIDILFEDAKWPEHWGLYFKVPDGDKIQHYGSFSFMPLTGNNEVKAGEFLINNFLFYLLLGKPDNPNAWGFHRLNKLIFTNGKVNKVLELSWEDKRYNQAIELSRIGTIKEPPAEWDDWRKK